MNSKIKFMDSTVDYKNLLILTIGLCPTLVISHSLKDSLVLSIIICIVTFMGNIITNISKKFTPESIRKFCNILIIMGIVSIVSLFLEAFFSYSFMEFGIYVPLVGISSIFIRNNFIFNGKDDFLLSLKYEMTLSLFLSTLLILTGIVREIVGHGTIWGISIFGEAYMPVLIIRSPAGALITSGFLLALINIYIKKYKIHEGKEVK